MMGGHVNPFPIQFLVNYWEIRPQAMGTKLNEILRQGTTHITTFLPWQAVESDISHTLSRFLQACHDRKMSVSLILTPEVGLHYSNSGLPKDVIAKKENTAQHSQSGPVAVQLPPNSVTLPSYFAPDFNKRYYSYLSRLDNLLADLSKGQNGILDNVTLVLSGGFWKYYRPPVKSAESGFSGSAGDYSAPATVAYRQRMDLFFAQREFADPTPAASNRWKTRALEEVNRRWFYQHSEEVFRHRTFQQLRKKTAHVKVAEVELFTPEADPSVSYSNFLQMVSGSGPDFMKLSQMLDQMAQRSTMGSQGANLPFIHWSSMGGFKLLSDSEKQFLILKSMLLMGGQGGGVMIDETEWFSFSPQFRSRAEALARSIAAGDLSIKNRALYFAPHLWSSGGMLWNSLSAKLNVGLKMVSSIDLILRERDANLVVVDPQLILTREIIQKLVGWAQGGRIVVLPRSTLYTESARSELERQTSQTRTMQIDLGVPYQLHVLGDGRIVVYEMEGMGDESLWNSFLTSVLALSEVDNICAISDSRLSLIPLRRKNDELALFVMNTTRRQVSADILFQTQVEVSDLAIAISASQAQTPEKSSVSAAATRFALDVPPFGILPLSVRGLPFATERERKEAAGMSEATRASAMSAAESELPGFSSDNVEGLWS